MASREGWLSGWVSFADRLRNSGRLLRFGKVFPAEQDTIRGIHHGGGGRCHMRGPDGNRPDVAHTFAVLVAESDQDDVGIKGVHQLDSHESEGWGVRDLADGLEGCDRCQADLDGLNYYVLLVDCLY